MDIIIGAGIMLTGILIGLLANRQSLKDKQAIEQGKPLDKIFEFVAEEPEKEIDDIMQGFANLMAYDGEVQKDEE